MSVFSDDFEDSKPQEEQPTTNSRNSAKTFQQWQTLRRSNPHKYFSTEGQKRLQQDALTLGRSAFFGKEGDVDNWWSK